MATPELTITTRIAVLITKQSALSTTNQQPPSKITATKVTPQSTSTSRIAVVAIKQATIASTNLKPSPKATASMASPWLTITSRIAAVLVVITKQLKPTDTKETAKIISNQDTKAISTSVSNYFNISATLSSSTFTISGKFLFERCENNKANKILVEERGGVKVRTYF